MRATSVMRFVVLGAVGFGIGGAIGTSLPNPLPLGVFVGGAIGGASLGLALKDWRRVIVLALLSIVGLTVGVFAALLLGSFVNYYLILMGSLLGAVVGASLGVAFRDWRVMVVLAAAGAVGFGIGLVAGGLLRASIPAIRGVGSIAITGIIGGASLGAALGYLEYRKRPHSEGRESR